MDFKDIRKLLLTMDEEKMTELIVEQFVKFMPTKDELIQLNSLKDKYDELSDAEKFGVVVSEGDCEECSLVSPQDCVCVCVASHPQAYCGEGVMETCTR